MEAGAVTQFCVKKLSPISKCRRSKLESRGAGSPKEFFEICALEVSPPRAEVRSEVGSGNRGAGTASDPPPPRADVRPEFGSGSPTHAVRKAAVKSKTKGAARGWRLAALFFK